MKKSLIYTLSGVAILSATAIATGASISTIAQNANSNIQSNYSFLDSSNNQNQEENANTTIENVATLKNIISNKINELNNISFANFQVNVDQLDAIKNLTQEDIYKNLIAKSYIEANDQFVYEIIDFKNNLANKTISFKIRVSNFNNDKEYLDTNLYSLSWTLKTNEDIQEIDLDEFLKMYNNPIYVFGSTWNKNDFKELVYNELSKDKNFDINSKTNYYHIQKGKFISEAESKWEDKKYLIAVDTQTGISFDVKEEKNYRKYLFRGQIITINKYYVNSITISGQNMLDTWLTKSVQKSISSIWRFSCPELTLSHEGYVTEEGFIIKDNKIVGYNGTATEIEIKSEYQIIDESGKFVVRTITEIADNAFENKNLRNVVLSNTISKIGNSAFKGNNIVSISFPDSVKEIGVSCFEDNLLTSLDLRNAQISHISNYAFANNNIMNLDWDSAVDSLGIGCFQNNLIAKVDFRNTRIKTISDFAFYHNIINELYWNSSVNGVGESAFERNQLSTVDFTVSSIKVVGKAAFKDNMIDTLVMHYLEVIKDSAFENNSMRTIDFSKSYNLTVIGSACFKNNKITSIIWNQKIEQVSREAFMYNKIQNDGLNLVSSKITCIDAFAFAYNDLSYNLWGKNSENIIHLPETIKLIGHGAFQSKEVYITKLDDDSVKVLNCNIFDVAGDADKFWKQVSVIRVISSDWIEYPSAWEYKQKWIQYAFNAFIVDVNGIADFGSL